MIKVKKQSVNELLDILIKTTQDTNPYARLTEILKQLFNIEDVKTLRTTLLLVLDTMNILSFDRRVNKFSLNSPTWYRSAIKDRFILVGSLSLEDINKLEALKAARFSENSIKFRNFEIELPDTYFVNISENEGFDNLGFSVVKSPFFSFVKSSEMLSVSQIFDTLIRDDLQINESKGIITVAFYKDGDRSLEYIQNQDEVLLFDWISRGYVKVNLLSEIEDPEGVKLIKVLKRKISDNTTYFETYNLFLEREIGVGWKYTYFDSNLVDERFARIVYLSKLEYFDLLIELKNKFEFLPSLVNNLECILKNPSLGFKELDIEIEPDLQNSNEIFKIPQNFLSRFIRYDKVKHILAVPVLLPLPQLFQKVLFSCTGEMPLYYVNNYRINPRYLIKLLFSGKLCNSGLEIPYSEESYFIREELFMYKGVPKELAKEIFDKLNLDFSEEIF